MDGSSMAKVPRRPTLPNSPLAEGVFNLYIRPSRLSCQQLSARHLGRHGPLPHPPKAPCPMSAAAILLATTGILAAGGLVESLSHRRNLARIGTRVHVNGTRGKSSVARLIAAGMRRPATSEPAARRPARCRG